MQIKIPDLQIKISDLQIKISYWHGTPQISEPDVHARASSDLKGLAQTVTSVALTPLFLHGASLELGGLAWTVTSVASRRDDRLGGSWMDLRGPSRPFLYFYTELH